MDQGPQDGNVDDSNSYLGTKPDESLTFIFAELKDQ